MASSNGLRFGFLGAWRRRGRAPSGHKGPRAEVVDCAGCDVQLDRRRATRLLEDWTCQSPFGSL